MENQNQNKNGKWEVLEVTEANGAKAYAVARRISASEPLSVTNMETHGPTLPKKDDAEYIAKNLNLADEAREREAAKSGECMENSEINGNKELGDKGFAIKITDVATGKVIKEGIMSCIVGVLVYASSGDSKRTQGDSVSLMKAPGRVCMKAIELMQDLTNEVKKQFMNEMLGTKNFDYFLDFIKRKDDKDNG